MAAKSILSIFAAAFLAASAFAAPAPAYADGFFDSLSITVTPKGKDAVIMRKALTAASRINGKNRAVVEQRGSNNGAGISQSGRGNVAGVFQKGNNNTALGTQTGNNNALAIVQLGNSKKANVTQTGNGKAQSVFQAGW